MPPNTSKNVANSSLDKAEIFCDDRNTLLRRKTIKKRKNKKVNALNKNDKSKATDKVPPGLIRGDVAGIKDSYTILLTNCIDPIAHMISEEFTFQMHSMRQIANGYAIEADTTCIKHIDIFDLASSIEKLIGSGFVSIDEVRSKAGLRGLNTKWSTMHYLTLNFTTAEAMVANNNANNNQISTNTETQTESTEGGESNGEGE